MPPILDIRVVTLSPMDRTRGLARLQLHNARKGW